MLHNGLGFTAEATAPKLRTFFHIHSPSAFPTQYFAARGHLSRLCTVGFENFQVIQVAIQSWAEGLRKRHNLRLEKRYTLRVQTWPLHRGISPLLVSTRACVPSSSQGFQWRGVTLIELNTDYGLLCYADYAGYAGCAGVLLCRFHCHTDYAVIY